MKDIDSIVNQGNVLEKLRNYVKTPLNEIKEEDDNFDLLKGVGYYVDAMNCGDVQQKEETLKNAKEHLEKYREEKDSKPLYPVFEDVVDSVLSDIKQLNNDI